MSSNPPSTGSYSGYQYILAYGLAAVILVLIAKTRIGYTFLYYTLVLCILYVALVDAQWIANTLAPITGNASASITSVSIDLQNASKTAGTMLTPPTL